MDAELRTQVVVVGAGNAGLSAAVAARQRGAEVIVLEKAPKEHRGGNSALTVHMLFAYEGVEDVKPLVGDLPPDVMRQMEERVTRYTKDMYYDNIMRVTEGKSEPELATILVERSTDTVQWMRGLGHLWAPTFDNPVSANVVSWEGGGHGMSTRWFDAFERVGGTVLYDTQAVDLLQDDQGRVIGVRALGLNGFMNIYAGAVIMAAGSFESNAEMRARYLGPLWDTIKLRGTPFNTGEGLQMAMNIGALPNGSWSSCHASPQDAERPAFDYPGYNKTGDFWSRYSYPFSVMVNLYGKRFVDEGETWRGLTYAKMGRAILAQPRGAAFQLFDQPSTGSSTSSAGTRRRRASPRTRWRSWPGRWASWTFPPSCRRSATTTTPRSRASSGRSASTGLARRDWSRPGATGRCRWTRRRTRVSRWCAA